LRPNLFTEVVNIKTVADWIQSFLYVWAFWRPWRRD